LVFTLTSSKRRQQLGEDARRSRASVWLTAAAWVLVVIYNIVGVTDIISTVIAIESGAGVDDAAARSVLYRVPVMPSLDGNTVELQNEQLAFSENAVGYAATLDFIRGRVDTLTRAIKGE